MIALDLGSYAFRSMRRIGDQLIGRRYRTDYIALPATDSKQELLDQSRIPYARCEDSFLLLGDAADAWSRMIQIPVSSVLYDGKIPAGDPPARQLLASMMESLLPKAVDTSEICAMTLPGGKIEEEGNGELAFFARVAKMRGYRVLPVHASHSLILSELGQSGLTGIGISLGAGICEMSIARHGVELIHATSHKAGNYLDQELAQFSDCYAWDVDGNRFLDLETIRDWKCNLERDLINPNTEDEKFLTDRYRSLLRTALRDLSLTFAKRQSKLPGLPRQIPLVLSGGLCQIRGFRKLFTDILSQMPFPFEISQIITCKDYEWNVTRGSLIHAELAKEPTQGLVRAA